MCLFCSRRTKERKERKLVSLWMWGGGGVQTEGVYFSRRDRNRRPMGSISPTVISSSKRRSPTIMSDWAQTKGTLSFGSLPEGRREMFQPSTIHTSFLFPFLTGPWPQGSVAPRRFCLLVHSRALGQGWPRCHLAAREGRGSFSASRGTPLLRQDSPERCGQ